MPEEASKPTTPPKVIEQWRQLAGEMNRVQTSEARTKLEKAAGRLLMAYPNVIIDADMGTN